MNGNVYKNTKPSNTLTFKKIKNNIKGEGKHKLKNKEEKK